MEQPAWLQNGKKKENPVQEIHEMLLPVSPPWHHGKEPACRLPMQETQETWVQSLGQEDPLEEGMATHLSILAWRIPWTEEPHRTLRGRRESDTTKHTQRWRGRYAIKEALAQEQYNMPSTNQFNKKYYRMKSM